MHTSWQYWQFSDCHYRSITYAHMLVPLECRYYYFQLTSRVKQTSNKKSREKYALIVEVIFVLFFSSVVGVQPHRRARHAILHMN